MKISEGDKALMISIGGVIIMLKGGNFWGIDIFNLGFLYVIVGIIFWIINMKKTAMKNK